METLDNIFKRPTRREMIRLGLACGVAGTLCRPSRLLAQDAAGTGEITGPKTKGIARHEAMHWQSLADKRVMCQLCPRECVVADGRRGYCEVRENRGGTYQTLVYGSLCAANVDPIEKKPLFHYLPDTQAFSIATVGCNIDCKFCQNWQISQARPEDVDSTIIPPQRLVETCADRKCPTIAYTYVEPTIFYEYMIDTARLAREKGIGSVMISNGFIQEKPLRELCRYLTGVKIDFKAFSPKFYEETCDGRLDAVLATLGVLKDIGIWFELVNLVIPTLNDTPEEITAMSRWIMKNLGPDVPIHFTRFHPIYKITNLPQTPVSTLERCRKIALDAGIHYAYAGNTPMHPGENTVCHSCGAELIRRVGFRVAKNTIQNGKCPKCGVKTPGVWSQEQALAFKPREKPAAPTIATQPS